MCGMRGRQLIPGILGADVAIRAGLRRLGNLCQGSDPPWSPVYKRPRHTAPQDLLQHCTCMTLWSNCNCYYYFLSKQQGIPTHNQLPKQSKQEHFNHHHQQTSYFLSSSSAVLVQNLMNLELRRR